MTYIIKSIDKEKYSNSNNSIYTVHLISDNNSNTVFELKIQGIKNDEEIKLIVNEFNNPLRLKNSYDFEPIEEMPLNNKVSLFSTEFAKNGYSCTVKSSNKDDLSKFIEYVNNPDEVGVDFLIKEHIRLGNLIDNHNRIIQKLNKERQVLEYRIWTHVWNEKYIDE